MAPASFALFLLQASATPPSGTHLANPHSIPQSLFQIIKNQNQSITQYLPGVIQQVIASRLDTLLFATS